MNKKNKIIVSAYALFVFAMLLIFFIKINPIAVFDSDDWEYISQFRIPIPMIRAWNPTKVFPEVFMPLISYAGAYLFYPATGDYCLSLSIIHGVFISMVITAYCLQFVVMMYKRLNGSMALNVTMGVIFFCLHFLMLWHVIGRNYYLFYAYNLTCIYNYTLSTVINAALVMHIIAFGGIDNLIKNSSVIHKILLFVWMYFCMYSNLFSSIVLISYLAAPLLIALFNDLKERKFSVKSYWGNNMISILIIFWWLANHVIEMTGGRSGSRVGSILSNFVHVLHYTITWATRINPLFLVIIIALAYLFFKKIRKNSTICFARYLLSGILTTVYLILLCTVVDSVYMRRPEVFLAIAFWLILALMVCIRELLDYYKKEVNLTIPASILFVICFLLTANSYRVINYNGLTYDSSKALMNDIISQFSAAKEKGLDEIDLYVPKFDTEDNWPLATYAGERFSRTLYAHGVMDEYIKVRNIIPSEEKYTQFVRYE